MLWAFPSSKILKSFWLRSITGLPRLSRTVTGTLTTSTLTLMLLLLPFGLLAEAGALPEPFWFTLGSAPVAGDAGCWPRAAEQTMISSPRKIMGRRAAEKPHSRIGKPVSLAISRPPGPQSLLHVGLGPDSPTRKL